MTWPMTRPRVASSARDAAMGTSIWATVEPAPTTRATPMSTPMEGASAEATRPAAVTSRTAGRNRRRVRMSPRGTRKAKPSAYPIWDRVTTSPAPPRSSRTSG